jgi:glycosyltransferase involved in cell wall biosynthesis
VGAMGSLQSVEDDVETVTNTPHLLLIQTMFVRPGGQESVVLRFARHFKNRGWRTTVLGEDVDMQGIARDVARVADMRVMSFANHRNGAAVSQFYIERPTYTYCMDMFSMLTALRLLETGKIGGRIGVGVYHPADNLPRRSFSSLHQRLRKWVFSRLPDPNISFMNEECRASHSEYFGRSFEGSPIFPVPVDEHPLRGSTAAATKIVSVGRLVDFKRYTFAVVDAVIALRRQGHDVTYDIYGHGPEEVALRKYINRHSAHGFVTVRGVLPHDRFNEVVAEYGVFVGMGSAALEAALLGVPTLLAIEGEARPLCHGWFGDVDGFCLGEAGGQGEGATYLEALVVALKLDAAGLHERGLRDRARALMFETSRVAPQFEGFLDNLQTIGLDVLPPGYRAWCWIDEVYRNAVRIRHIPRKAREVMVSLSRRAP